MKGNPILRLCLVLLLLAAVLVPVSRFAMSRAPAPNVSSDPTPGKSEAESVPHVLQGRLLLHAAPSPLHCAVTLRGKTLLTDKNLLSPGEYAADAEIAPGDDLVISAEWTDENPHAVRAEFLPRGMAAPVTGSYWARRSLEDVLTVPAVPTR